MTGLDFNPFIDLQIETKNKFYLENECSSATNITFLNRINPTRNNNTIEYLISTILYSLRINFLADVERYPYFDKNLMNKASEYFNITINKFAGIPFNNLIYSLTDSNSIYFRFYKDGYVGHIEVFYDYIGTDQDIEAIISLYNNDQIILKQYGRLDALFNLIKKEIEPISETNIFLASSIDVSR